MYSIHTTNVILQERFKLYTVSTFAQYKQHFFAEKITNSANKMIKMDIDKSKAGRPWRMWNLYHGIIATRRHDTDYYEKDICTASNE